MAGLEAVGGHSHGVVESSDSPQMADFSGHPVPSNSHGHSHEDSHGHAHSQHFLDTLKNSLLKFKNNQSNQAGHDHAHEHHEDGHEDHDHEDHGRKDHGHEDHGRQDN